MRKIKSAILEAVLETARGLHKAGVMDQLTLREFDRLCVPPVTPLKPAQIKRIRESSRVSQGVFARLLNTSVSTRPEVGDRPEEAHRHRPQAAPSGARAWLRCCGLVGNRERERMYLVGAQVIVS